MAKEFDFSQFEKFAESWQKTYNDFEMFLKKFLLQQAQRVIAGAKGNTPVDTGALRAMWGVGSQKLVTKSFTGWSEQKGKYQEMVNLDPSKSDLAVIDMVGNNFEISIWNGMEYASFIEYGHRRVNGAWQEGRFMFTIAMHDVQKKMPYRFQKAWEQFLISHGVK